MSLLLVVALALSTTVRGGRPMSEAGRQGVPERAAAVMPQPVLKAARRVSIEKPPASPGGLARRMARPPLGAASTAPGPGRRPAALRESLLDLPPPVC